MVTLNLNSEAKGAVFTAVVRDKDGQSTTPTSVGWSLSDPTVLLIQGDWGGDPLKAHVETLAAGDCAVAFACEGGIGASELVRVVAPEPGPPASVTLDVLVDW
jgi:hypothetical protein